MFQVEHVSVTLSGTFGMFQVEHVSVTLLGQRAEGNVWPAVETDPVKIATPAVT